MYQTYCAPFFEVFTPPSAKKGGRAHFDFKGVQIYFVIFFAIFFTFRPHRWYLT